MGLAGIHNGLERMVGFQRGERAWVELGWVVVARVGLCWVGLGWRPLLQKPTLSLCVPLRRQLMENQISMVERGAFDDMKELERL